MSEGRPRLPTATREELTARQREVMRLMAAGRTNFEIAQQLGLSLEGAKYHVSEILGKLGVDSREEAVAAWRQEQRPLVRLRRALAPIAASSWLRPALALGVLVLALGIGILLVLLATSGDSDPDDDPVPAVTDPDPTPTSFPPDNVPASCAADRAHIVHPAWGPAAGDGPVYASFGPPIEPGQRTLTYYPPNREGNYPEGWGGQHLMWIVEEGYDDPITLSATRLDGAGAMEFIGPSKSVLLPLDGGPTGWRPNGIASDGWRSYANSLQIPLDAGGCYAIDLTGPGLSQRIVVWAELNAAGPPPPAPSDPPVCGPPPPLLKPPSDGPGFVRIAGQTYLSQSYLGRGPSLVVDPALVGREIGRIKWNVGDPDIDHCHGELDGSTSALPPGATIHELQGYRQDFRVVAETPYGWRIFESDWRDGADSGADLIDIRGKVVSVYAEEGGVVSQQVGRTWSVPANAVDDLVDRLLDQSLVFTETETGEASKTLTFVFGLEDGSNVERFWFAGPRPYSSGIPVSEAFLDEVTALLEQSQ